MRLNVCALILCAIAVGCGKDSPTQPTPTPTPTPVTPAPTLSIITGTVSSAASGPLGDATVRVIDGPNAGMTAPTDGSGRYTLSGLTFSGFTITASAPGHIPVSRGGILQPGVTTNTANFTLLPEAAFSRSGTGDTVFNVPTYITRIRVQANYGGSCQNFVIRIARRLVVNEILGSCSVASGRAFDGTYTTNGGVAEVTNSTGVNWAVSEVR